MVFWLPDEDRVVQAAASDRKLCAIRFGSLDPSIERYVVLHVIDLRLTGA
jgi:hypothetical protein